MRDTAVALRALPGIRTDERFSIKIVTRRKVVQQIGAIRRGRTGNRFPGVLVCFLVGLLAVHNAFSQRGRIPFNNQQLFLSGANLAWVDFAGDVGPGYTAFDVFADVLLQIHDHGGNTLRWWLHTNGSVTPEFDGSGFVTGPGDGTIEDMKKILDLAWEREIGVKICLWSFNMLETRNSSTVLNRNILLLTDTSYTRAYINTCLIPMVDSLKNHPAILAWEIFNEPEGMSVEFGWSETQHVPMADIQRFINLCTGAIHRTDSTAQVTNGAWSFLALTDVPTARLGKVGVDISQLAPDDRERMERRFLRKYGWALTAEEILGHLEKAAALANVNYYTDARLISAGGDTAGTLDFYSVHYYDWAGIALSPFHYNVGRWGLDKYLVVAEFDLASTYGIPATALFDTLYRSGYAGALPWAWTDRNFSSQEEMLASMQYMWDTYRDDVDVDGVSGDWPIVSITSPGNDEQFPDSADVTIVAEASDSDGSVTSVEFFVSDTSGIGIAYVEPYSIIWTGMAPGVYVITAVVTDDRGNKRTSEPVRIVVGSPTIVKLEAENAALEGTPNVRTNPAASNGRYVTMQQTGTITWQLPGVPAAGTYDIVFGYRLSYDTPKSQYINVNGERITELVFDGALYAWLEKGLTIGLVQGDNTVQMELSWGWMDLDYLGVPAGIIVSSVTPSDGLPAAFALEQNFPNPFNPGTTIRYTLAEPVHVRLAVHDILGRQVEVLVDERQTRGVYGVPFDAGALASGVYFCHLEAGTFAAVKRMLLLK